MMKKENSESPAVPEQHTGIQKDIEKSRAFEDIETARKTYRAARKRLLDVNNWHILCEGMATFTLRDEQGKPVGRLAQQGDYFQIDLPAPGNQSGDGFDWVQIEVVEENSGEEKESTSLRVRPASSPLNDRPDTAHFLDEAATSTFLVMREGRTVRAEVHARNETPNTDAETLVDKIRNTVTAIGAWLGFSDIQWKRLTEALIEPPGPQT